MGQQPECEGGVSTVGHLGECLGYLRQHCCQLTPLCWGEGGEAVELGELLAFFSDWLASDRNRLEDA